MRSIAGMKIDGPLRRWGIDRDQSASGRNWGVASASGGCQSPDCWTHEESGDSRPPLASLQPPPSRLFDRLFLGLLTGIFCLLAREF